MLLSRLHLSNFRQYRQLDLNFKDGITGIVGRNGSGKSTILEAVLWCLFGNRAARTGKEGIKSQLTPATDPCTVELEFILENATYCLTRSLVGKSSRSEAHLHRHGHLDAVSTRGVDETIIRLIGLNLKGFLSSFFARQKELNALSDARPADRKDHLARMLGVGRLDNAIQLLKEEIKTTRQRIEILGTLQVDPVAVNQELGQKKSEIADFEKSRASITEGLANLEKDITARKLEVDRLRQIEQEHNRLEKENSTLKARKEAAEKEISRLSSELDDLHKVSGKLEPLKIETAGIEQLEKEVLDLKQARIKQEENARLKGDLNELRKSESETRPLQTKLNEQISNFQSVLADKDLLKQAIKNTEKQIDDLLMEHRELAAEIRVIEDKLATMNKQKSEIDKLGPEASCQLCLRPFAGELDEIEHHFDQEILSLNHQIEPMRKRLDEIKDDGQKLRRELKSKKEKQDHLNTTEKHLVSAQANLNAIITASEVRQKRVSEIETRLGEIGEIVFDLDKLKSAETSLMKKQQLKEDYIRLVERVGRKPELETGFEKSKNSLASITAELDKNVSRKKEIGFDPDEFRKSISDLEKARDEAGRIRVEIEKTEGRIRLLTSEAEAMEKKLAEYEKSRVEIERLREELTYLEKLSIMFNEFRVYLIGRIRPSLSRRTSELFHEMTGGRYQEIELDEDYSLRVYDRGEPFAINRFSGGEIDLANLCFRLAISVEMASTAGIQQSFIILDEIFGSQDAERQRMIFEGLGRLKNRFRQIIIISHIDDVKEMAENIISVEVDRSGVSRAVALEN
jgi:exonuclease SbcC